jgi:hypothetical protein
VEAKARDVHIIRTPRQLQQLENANTFPDVAGAYPARLTRQVKLFQAFMSERAGHSALV